MSISDCDESDEEICKLLKQLFVKRHPFNEMLENEYWYYDNHGLKLLQVRIYPNEVDITYADDPYMPE